MTAFICLASMTALSVHCRDQTSRIEDHLKPLLLSMAHINSPGLRVNRNMIPAILILVFFEFFGWGMKRGGATLRVPSRISSCRFRRGNTLLPRSAGGLRRLQHE
jgi:hypothetical protein